MLRTLYLWLIQAHPSQFRRQFGDEMTWIFDQAADRQTRMSLLGDALFSVLRQRWMRPVLVSSTPAAPAAGIPAFHSIDTSLPPTRILWGAVLSVLILLAASVPDSGRPPRRSVGITHNAGAQQRARATEARSSFANHLRRVWSAIAAALPSHPSSAQVRLPPLAAGYLPPPVPVRQQGAADVLLGMLDADGDMILTRSEMERAPGVLRELDADIDGFITWSECEAGRAYLKAPRHASKLFAIIDSTGNGVISRAERLLSRDALIELDTNQDGKLTNREYEEKTMQKAAVLLTLAVTSLAAQRPNFTGQWKLNLDKSEFANKPIPAAASMKVDHKEPSLILTRIIDTGNGEVTSQTTYSTDGKETINKLPNGAVAKNRATWDGSSLTIESPAEVNGKNFVIRWKWTLSSDQKTLTTVRTFAPGEPAMTEIYERH